jgi:hypothetical protein
MLQLLQDIAPGRVDTIVAQVPPRADRWFVAERCSVDRREGFRFRAGTKKHLRMHMITPRDDSRLTKPLSHPTLTAGHDDSRDGRRGLSRSAISCLYSCRSPERFLKPSGRDT